MKRIMLALAFVAATGGAITWFAKLDARYAKAGVVGVIYRVADDLERHKIESRMKALQERMWAMEDYWGEKFRQETGEIHGTLEELLAFMTKEARGQYRRLQAEYRDLEKRLGSLDDDPDGGGAGG